MTSATSAPGKLIITGEYAVLDGAPAIVLAIDRRVRATAGGTEEPSLFVRAVADELARRGDRDAAARALAVRVDSSALYAGELQGGATKLGLGSSAAVTVATAAFALGSPLDRDRVYAVALAAHAAAQATRGAAGSGADIAAATYGGATEFAMSTRPRAHAWPGDIALVPFFTGRAADTATFVARIAAASDPAVADALRAIGDASAAACAALAGIAPANLATANLATPHLATANIATANIATANLADTGRADLANVAAFVAALVADAEAFDALARAARVPELVPPCVRAIRAALPSGYAVKTTGAGGGDVAVVVAPAAAVDRARIAAAIAAAGATPLALAVDDRGVAIDIDIAPASE